MLSLTQAAKDHLLQEGTDVKYGARMLKRTIENKLVHPLCNLMASKQVNAGDVIREERVPAHIVIDAGRSNGRRWNATVLLADHPFGLDL